MGLPPGVATRPVPKLLWAVLFVSHAPTFTGASYPQRLPSARIAYAAAAVTVLLLLLPPTTA